MSDLKFAVGTSKSWDPKVAGQEATSKALLQLKDKPRFLLVFSTIHYNDREKGLERMLEGCREKIGLEIPLIGGTVVGFICPEGSHTRGVVTVAVSGENIDIVGEYSKNIRRNRYITGEKIANSINEQLLQSKKRNKLVISFMAGPVEPYMLTYKLIRFIIKKIPFTLLRFIRNFIMDLLFNFFHFGPSAEEDIFDGMSKILKNYYLIGCSTFDDIKCLRNFQFFNNVPLTDSIVALGVSLDNEIIMETKMPLISLGKKIKIRPGWKGYGIDMVGNKPFIQGYHNEMGWSNESWKPHVEQLMRLTFYYPMGYTKDNHIYTFPAGFYIGDTMLTNIKIRSDEVELFLTSSRKILEDYKTFLENTSSKDKLFTFIFDPFDLIGIFGSKVYLIKDMMDKALGDTPYLIIIGCGQYSKKVGEKIFLNNYPHVMQTILRN